MLTSGGLTVLIDAGPKEQNYDAGEKLVLPALRRLGVDGVDLILLSHPDIDHMGGVGAIHRAFPHAAIAASAEFREWPSMNEHLRACGLSPEEVTWLPMHCRVTLGSARLRIWCPPMAAHENDNDGSMFVHVEDGDGTAAFSGDAPSEVELAALLDGDWRSQVMKAGHHGSRSATCQAWIDAVHPRIAVLSVGRNNRYGHPHQEVVERLQHSGVEVWRTDRQGDAVFDLTATGFQVRR